MTRRLVLDLALPVLTLVAAVAALVFAVTAFVQMHRSASAGHLVTVDLVRVMNAERAALPNFARGGDQSLRLLRLGHSLMPTVKAVAGPGKTVLVRQAVVNSGLPDITDAVLKKLGLPLHAPTISLSSGLLDAPTTANVTQGGVWQKHLQRQNAAIAGDLKETRRKNAHDRLP